MYNLHHEIESLEEVCNGDKSSLITYNLPRLTQIVETITLLPRPEQEEFFGRLERISMILEGQMMELSEELAQLKKQIPAAQLNSVATRAYNRTVAVIPMKPTAANNNEK